MHSQKAQYIVEPRTLTLSNFLPGLENFVMYKDRVKKEESFTEIQLYYWQQSYLTEIFWQRYSSRIVLREKFDCYDGHDSVMEVLDGWMRIDTIKRFLKGQIPLSIQACTLFPNVLINSPNEGAFVHKLNECPTFTYFINSIQVIHVDVIKGIEKQTDNPSATQLFTVLQNHQYPNLIS